MSNNYIQVEFKALRWDVFHNPLEFPFKKGDWVYVEVDKGSDIGRVHDINYQICTELDSNEEPKEYHRVLRKAYPEEIKKVKENREKEQEAIALCRSKVRNHGLEMKVIDSEFQFDYNRVTFYFIAENRVDFRELVKDLAQEYRTRIELRQIGARDEARRVGGCGVCGIQRCCTANITDFTPISTQFAKDQNLTLNPSKLSGACGKLKCCLAYERNFYKEMLHKFPSLNSTVSIKRGVGTVEKVDILKEFVYLRFEDDLVERFSFDEIMDLVSKAN